MKTLKKTLFILPAAFTLLIISCQKDATVVPGGGLTNPGSGTQAMQLTRLDEDAQNYSTITYNTDNTVASYTNVNAGTTTAVTATYNADKKPVTATVANELYKISYKNNQIDRVNIYQDKTQTNSPDFYFTYAYINNRISETDLFLTASNLLTLKTTSEYDAHGHITTQKLYSLDPFTSRLVLTSTYTYTYDDKVNPLQAIYDFTSVILGAQSANNAVKIVETDGSGNVAETDTYTYSYNSNNYPTQTIMKSVKPGSADETTTSKFTYK